MTGGGRRGVRLALRATVSLAVLAALAYTLDAGAVLSRLRAIRPAWIALAVGISVVQVGVSAWRWRFTAGRLGIDLPFGTALREYYLATFLNQVVPGGVAGDVSRAWRHAARPAVDGGRTGAAVRAVVLERASGQAIMAAVAAVSLLALPLAAPRPTLLLAAGTPVGAAVVGGALWRRRGPELPSPLRRLWRDAHAALLSRDALPAQVAGSCSVVGTYLAVFLVAARAVGVEAGLLTILPVVAPILVAMLVPVSVAGWGVREGAAATLWPVVGLAPAEGVAVSMTYGVLVLLGSAPGAVVLAGTVLATPRRPGPAPGVRPEPRARSGITPEDPDRRARPLPEGSDGRGGEGPREGSRREAASAPGARSR